MLSYQNGYNEHHQNIEEAVMPEVVKLYQSDFDSGTYRITRSATYQIMEDIVFDFNAGDVNDPNSGDLQWWPTSDQADVYEGTGSTRGL